MIKRRQEKNAEGMVANPSLASAIDGTEPSSRSESVFSMERQQSFCARLRRLLLDVAGARITVSFVVGSPRPQPAFSNPEPQPAFCKLVQSCRSGERQCATCYQSHLEQVEDQNKVLRYTCHAGLTNTLIPMPSSDGQPLYLLLGRVSVEPSLEKRRTAAEKNWSNLPISQRLLRATLDDVPHVPDLTLRLAIMLARCLFAFERPAKTGQTAGDKVKPPQESLAAARSDKVRFATASSPLSSGMGSQATAYLTNHCQAVCDSVKAEIEKSYATALTIADLSQVVRLSPNYLSSVFHAGTGLTVKEYLTRVRIRKAKELLALGNLSVKEVSAAVGYADPNYFSRVFRRETSVSPLSWRVAETALKARQNGRLQAAAS